MIFVAIRPVLPAFVALVLAACAAAPHKAPEIAVPRPQPSGPMLPMQPAAPIEPPQPIMPPVFENTTPPSPWDRLRARLAMPGCDYSSAVRRWTRIFTQGPQRFAASLQRALPFLLIVLDELERQDLPGEFALLPYLESTYEPIATNGNRPAGMWQFVPDTAREAGLVVTRDYDGRLDAYASAEAAVSLLKRYQDEFGDWRLVDMAFNAGEYRVKQQLRSQAGELDAASLAKLKLSPITHDHLAKLLALGCIVAEPERFNVSLPEPSASDYLEPVALGGPIDLRVAARLADLAEPELRRFNAGYRTPRTTTNSPLRLLLPAEAAQRFQQRYAKLAPEQWAAWQPLVLSAPHSVAELAEHADTDADLLGTVNGVDTTRAFAAGATVLLPGSLAGLLGSAARKPAPIPGNPSPRAHVVSNGDTLWDIAKRYRISVTQLQLWNALGGNASLKPGQKLLLAAPE